MNEIFSPFKSKEKMLQILLCGLIFIGMAVPFKVMVIIEGITGVRPVNAVPVVAGLLFGPAGAWGCAIGNLIADSTFTKGTILGFLSNFIAAYLPYKVWHIIARGQIPNVKSYKNIIKFTIVTMMTALASAIIIACGLDVLFGMWMPSVFWIILFNDLGFPILIGLPVFIVLTSEESNFKITMPERGRRKDKGKGYFFLEYFLLGVLVLSELALLWMIAFGLQISTSLLMAISWGIFMIALLAFIFHNGTDLRGTS